MLQDQLELVLQLLTEPNRLVMRVALHTGLRVGDVLRLKPQHLRPNFWITEQKTEKRRQVGLPAPLLDDLRQIAGREWVFEGVDPRQHRTRQAVWKDVKRAAKACRIPQNVGTHSARKVYAVELLERYGDIDRVRRALNHSDPETTLIYAMADKLLRQRGRRRRGQPGRKRA